MKMGSGMFWGILLIVIGISLILKIIFHIDFPIFKIIIAFVLIYLGIKMLVGPNFKIFKQGKQDESSVAFGRSEFKTVESGKEYNVVFGKGEFNLSGLKLDSIEPTKIRLNSVFGSTEMTLPANMPVKIDIDAAFAGVRLPEGNTATFGSTTYRSKNLDTTLSYLHIKADVVFGSLNIVQSNL